MGETRVDLQHLLEDLRDAYTGALEETILTEVVANALDSGASRVRLLTSPSNATLTIIDDGSGMQRRELARYHDIAASTKSRGEGIGFAGVGIKLGLLVSREVITETRRGATHVATRWHLASRRRAPWKWIQAPGLTESRGTAVQLILANQLSPLLDAGYLEETIRRHFEPLLDPMFDDLLGRYYRRGVGFEVDGRELSRTGVRGAEIVAASIKIGRRRTPSAIGFIERNPLLPADRAGIAISTFGKVIKRGWDWLGVTPVPRAHVGGLIEAPDLAGCLTLSKNDFIRTGTRGAIYLAYRKAIQEVVSRQLAQWGDAQAAETRPRTERLERDLERVLEDLADEFPLLRSLVDRRAGGQKRLPMPGRGTARAESPQGENEGASPHKPESDGDHQSDTVAATAGIDTILGRRRRARYGLLLQFESRPADAELARLVDTTIFINDAHPAFARAIASRSIGYHTALAVALALAPLTVEPAEEHTFITHFLAHWGQAENANRPSGRRRRSPKKTK